MYYYRVRSFNAQFVSASSARVGARIGATGEGNSGSNHSSQRQFFLGMNVARTLDADRVIPILRDLGITGVRLWSGLTHWSNRFAANPIFRLARTYHDAGFNVTLLTQCKTEVPNYQQVKAYFDYVQTLPGLKRAVDRWEIMNEPDYRTYWPGTLTQYVKNVLHGAWDSLHPAGETVVGAATVSNLRKMQEMIDAGYARFCDIANIHPYASNLAAQKNTINSMINLFGNKPITATEWNFHPRNESEWPTLLAQAYPFVSQKLESAFYYRFMVSDSTAGPAGAVQKNFSKHNPFYDLIKSWKDED
jgi:hypothetical protein